MSHSLRNFRRLFLVLIFLTGTTYLLAADSPAVQFCQQVSPLQECLSGQRESFQLTADLNVKIDGKPQSIKLHLIRYDNEAFDLSAHHSDYSFQIFRRSDQTIFELPHHQKRFVSSGDLETKDHLASEGILTRLIDADSSIATYLPMLQTPPSSLGFLLNQFVEFQLDEQQQLWTVDNKTRVQFQEGKTAAEPWQASCKSDDWTCDLSITAAPNSLAIPPASDNFAVETLDRNVLERQLCRGVKRAIAILSPSKRLTDPTQKDRSVEHGQLQWIDGQRVALLWGTSEEIGQAHAQLLARQATRCMDSVLYTFGTVQTIRTGRWFQHDLEEAYARLSPHIPEDHKRELTALAEEMGWDPNLANVLNVFPELFHCSGFAVFDSATKDGTLYHGRVLDYMTTIGLQYSSVTFIVAPQGKIPFANVGYGGFTGCVTGMNQAGISLGEMGGRGEGQWDGVPMATLMRIALENCQTLEEVKTLWATSPRTCEYYYVFADGKTNSAVGVAATPEKIQFVEPGEFHELLGEGIPDVLALSAGQRLQTLRSRIQEKHGQIDTETAIWLMSRPVAMQSNLHNTLFIPKQGLLYVANADHKHPAAERPYVKLDLNALLKEIDALQSQE